MTVQILFLNLYKFSLLHTEHKNLQFITGFLSVDDDPSCLVESSARKPPHHVKVQHRFTSRCNRTRRLLDTNAAL